MFVEKLVYKQNDQYKGWRIGSLVYLSFSDYQDKIYYSERIGELVFFVVICVYFQKRFIIILGII